MTSMTRFIPLLTLVALAIPSIAHAQTKKRKSSRAPHTIPADQGFHRPGRHRIPIPGAELQAPIVDRRAQDDALVAHGGLFSNAALPPAGSLTYTNHLFIGNQLSWAPTDALLLSATYVAPLGLLLSDEVRGNTVITNYDTYDQFLTFRARTLLHKTRDLTVSIEPTLLWRTGTNISDTSELGVGVSGLIDYNASDYIVLGAGLSAHIPLTFSTRALDINACPDRDAYTNGQCTETIEQTQLLPPGGRFMTAHVAATILGPKNYSLKFEAMTGFTTGTALDLEGTLWGRDDTVTQNRRYLDGALQWGVPRGAPFMFTASGGWRNAQLAAQAGVAVIPWRLDQTPSDTSHGPILYPTLSIAYRFL